MYFSSSPGGCSCATTRLSFLSAVTLFSLKVISQAAHKTALMLMYVSELKTNQARPGYYQNERISRPRQEQEICFFIEQ